MEKIPTAEELYFKVTSCVMNHKDIKTAMIEFAKLHVKAALEAGTFCLSNGTLTYEDECKILNAYPLENIK